MAKNVFRQGKKVVSISASGALNLRFGKIRLTGSKLEVKLESGRAIFPLRGAQLSPPLPNDYLPGGGSRVYAANQQGGLCFYVNVVLPEEGLWAGLSVEIRNLQRAAIPLQRVTLLRIPLRKIHPVGSAPKPYMLIDAGHSSGAAGLHALSGTGAEDELAEDTGGTLTALFTPGGGCVVAGCVLTGKTVPHYMINRDQLTILAEVNAEIPPHGTFQTDLLLIGTGESLPAALQRFGTFQVGRHRAAEAADYHAWTSCDWYRGELAESDIMDNLEFLKETPWLRDNLKYIVVGRGWQRSEGDWEPNERFPSLMDTIASRIADAGFTPGIWTAPLAVRRRSSTAQEHPDWILRSVDRRQEEDPAQLDFTLPEVRDFLYQTFRRLSRWGYRYFRTDFPHCCLDPKRYKFRGKRGAVQQCLRSAMTAIRAAIGEDAFWVAGEVPFLAVAGLCDAVAVAPPVSPYFSTLVGCARAGMFRYHYHGKAWLNDPGLLVVRGPQTAQPEGLRPGDNAGGPYERYGWEKGPMVSLNEARMWATYLVVSGGILTLGDRLASLRAEGLEIVRKAITRCGSVPAAPLDLGVVPLPRIWQRVEGRAVTLALFNWSDSEQDIVVTKRQGALLPAEGELYEVWKDAAIPAAGDTLRRRLAARSCELLEWELEA